MWANVDLPSEVFYDIHLRAIPRECPATILYDEFEILLPYLPGANELKWDFFSGNPWPGN